MSAIFRPLAAKILIIAIFLAGCSYQPVAKIAQNSLGKSVFIDTAISKIDPQNSVVIKDSLTEAAIKRMGLSLASKADADTAITAAISSLNFAVITYDSYGYATAYRAELVVQYTINQKGQPSRVYKISGDYDFRVSRQVLGTRLTDSIISDAERYEAIRAAAEQTFDELVSRIAIDGLKSQNRG